VASFPIPIGKLTTQAPVDSAHLAQSPQPIKHSSWFISGAAAHASAQLLLLGSSDCAASSVLEQPASISIAMIASNNVARDRLCKLSIFSIFSLL
jgi:hypothetical protein